MDWRTRLSRALTQAADAQQQKTYTEGLIDKSLERGNIREATDLAKEGLRSSTSGLLLAGSFGMFGPATADIINMGLTIPSAVHLASKNGIRKTYDAFNARDYKAGLKSAAGDLLDLSFVGHTAGLVGRIGKTLKETGTFRNTALSNFRRNLFSDYKIGSGKYFHGSPKRNITEFKPGVDGGIYWTSNPKAARGYTGNLGTGKVYEASLDLGKNPIIIDNAGSPWTKIPEQKVADAFGMSKKEIYDSIGHYNAGADPWYTDFLKPFGYKSKNNTYAIDQVTALGRNKGVSSITLKNARDNGKGLFGIRSRNYDQTIVYDPSQIHLQNIDASNTNILKSVANAYRSDIAGRELANNISKTVIPGSDITKNILAGKIGWGPSTSNTLWHNSDKPLTELKVDYPAWDVTERNAPLGHVWLSDRETTSGFLAKRPYHLKSKVALNKPMIQVGEAIGDGKNATRNEILDFAQKSNADALQFKNIADNQLTGQNISAVFKDVALQPKLSEVEKLGIPKDLQSNPRALEDPYYWGYEQWNQRYNDAVKTGNIKEAQRLRDLHFQTKAINNQLQVDGHPITLYHGNLASDSQLASAGYNPYSTARTAVGSSGYFAVTDPQIASTYKGPSGSIKTVYGYSKNPAVYDAKGRNGQDAFIKEVDGHKFGIKTDAGVNSAFNSGHDAVLIDNVVDYGFNTPASHPRQPFTDYVFKPGHVKLRDAVVEDGLFFEPIPIVKRDNFHNPDIRYKQGGTL